MTLKQRDIAFEGTTIHCYEGGRGYPLLMIHGSGPGTASASNWIHTMEPLSRRYRIIAMDLIGYGLSGRNRREPYFDVEMWTRQARHVLDRLSKKGPVGIVVPGAVLFLYAPLVGRWKHVFANRWFPLGVVAALDPAPVWNPESMSSHRAPLRPRRPAPRR